ncbi:hypothetical protein RI030_09025 [Aphanizomenon flos-aquae NRERC-008]|uniref:Uncharacterized protein n=2 Tax=Aphanizomenon flos-aquae TaxID=1176 RepID=A0ABR8IRY3_APHFL|nr:MULTISPECIES: hypothetical protein [Aphanizomenon]MBD2631425.1 hypothetical protein [Aphanizomenon sp. FACHB-1399]MBD2642521.1 hypothetical protein [Aphanizomenon sp. FACHB-1401]MBD2685437.1 hypothetical protein [Aphanizomenon flos-aquae FACHB-1249]MDS9397734.1 hypothetical protein [Aphanizomenon flos-aquae NRERC-008]
MKQKNNPAQILKDKKDKLDWQNFNFLENLLVFCTVPGRSVPKESRVHFRITLDSENQAICILFEIDRRNDPLIRNQALKRPDYMSVYIDSNSCICTIIEMKGKNHNSLENGIEQILRLKEILQTEISNHLPSKLKIKYQGILLTPYNSQPPLKKIAEIASTDFIILPIQYNNKAELFPYVSRKNEITEISKKYNHQEITESTALLIEEILTTRALPKRIPDEYYSKNFSNSQDREGIYINYLLPNDTDYITLLSNTTLTEINMEENEYMKEIIEELKLLNLIDRLAIKFSNTQISNYDN